MNGKRLVPAVTAAAITGLAVVGCAIGSSPATAQATSVAPGGTIDIYSSLPMQGQSSARTVPMVNGIRLALAQAHGKAGAFTVRYIALDDSTTVAGRWDPIQTAANARQAANDPEAVYYIGDLDAGAARVSVPILRAGGLAGVSPANLSAYPGAARFAADYRKAYGAARANPYTISGYEAMRLGLQAIAKLGREGGGKAALLRALTSAKAAS